MFNEVKNVQLGNDDLIFDEIRDFVFLPNQKIKIELCQKDRIERSHTFLQKALEEKQSVYGVTTGFGDCSRRIIDPNDTEKLQENLVNYLTCGLGPILPIEVCRGTFLFRLHSLARGYSAVTLPLLEEMQWMLENNIIPKIPSQGSLGASGDLVPLAYIAQAVQGRGSVWHQGEDMEMADVLRNYDRKPYSLKAKEGLALVNGTSVMAGYAYYNLYHIEKFMEWAVQSTALACISLQGRRDSFDPLINQVAKQFTGQAKIAKDILGILDDEDYQSPDLQKALKPEQLDYPIQDKYSLRCAPQILGPIYDTLKMTEQWIQKEASGVSDNPLTNSEGQLKMGGNFYGGYISHGMDYLKISLAHMVDMMDRQFMCLIDEACNRGLPANLSGSNLSEKDRHLHHGLKGLNQAMSAITSEVMALSTPSGIFSRSSEAHNQDKVSLGLSACSHTEQIFDRIFSLFAIHLTGLCQAIDLRQQQLKSPQLLKLYEMVRKNSTSVNEDRPLDHDLNQLKRHLEKEIYES